MKAFEKVELRVISFGGGQDSAEILNLVRHSSEYAIRYQQNRLLFIFSDTGDEHEETYQYVREAQAIAQAQGWEFHWLTKDLGFHTPSWQSLIEAMEKVSMIVQIGTKSCTDHLKLVPIYKFLDEWINKTYGYGFPVSAERGCRKQAIQKFYEQYGSIRVQIGFARGEETQMQKSINREQKDHEGNTWARAIEREFPLIELGLSRADCQEDLKRNGQTCPIPSNCMRCPYMSKQELLWLYRKYPEKFEQWCNLEDAKIAKWLPLEGTQVKDREGNLKFDKKGHPVMFKNNGVFNGKKRLREVLTDVLAKYGHMMLEELEAYKFSHGHCVKNAY